MNYTELKIYLNPKCENKLGQFSFTFKKEKIVSEKQDVRFQVTDDITIGEIKNMITNPEEIWSLEINIK